MSNDFVVLISIRGTKGDVYPLLGIALELKQRNIHVIFQTNEFFREDIEAQGIEFLPMGTAANYIAANRDPDMWNPDIDMDIVNQRYSICDELEQGFHSVVELHKQHRKLFVVSIGSLSGARMAATKLSIPQAVVILQPAGIVSFVSPSSTSWETSMLFSNRLFFNLFRFGSKLTLSKFGRKFIKFPEHINALFNLYTKLGVYKQETNFDVNYPRADILIGLFPEWFGMPAKDWPKKLALTGFPLFSPATKPGQQTVDEFIRQQGAPIIFTSGTGVFDKSDIFREGRKICEQLNVPGIFVGGDSNQHLLGDSPLCLHVDYIDFNDALPKSRAIVHHGGIGTLAQAIKAGVPQLIRPLKIDQPDNANRIAKLGLGAYLLLDQFSAESAAPLLKSLMEQAPGNKALKAYSSELQSGSAIQKACDLIVQQLALAGTLQ